MMPFAFELLLTAALSGSFALVYVSPVSAFISNELSGSGARRPDAERS